MEVEPSFAAGLLPATLVMGTGIGMAPAILLAAGVASVGPSQFSVASGVGQEARQLGSAIGVAVVVAILGDGLSTDPAEPLAAFDRAFLYLAAVATLAGLIAIRLRSVVE